MATVIQQPKDLTQPDLSGLSRYIQQKLLSKRQGEAALASSITLEREKSRLRTGEKQAELKAEEEIAKQQRESLASALEASGDETAMRIGHALRAGGDLSEVNRFYKGLGDRERERLNAIALNAMAIDEKSNFTPRQRIVLGSDASPDLKKALLGASLGSRPSKPDRATATNFTVYGPGRQEQIISVPSTVIAKGNKAVQTYLQQNMPQGFTVIKPGPVPPKEGGTKVEVYNQTGEEDFVVVPDHVFRQGGNAVASFVRSRTAPGFGTMKPTTEDAQFRVRQIALVTNKGGNPNDPADLAKAERALTETGKAIRLINQKTQQQNADGSFVDLGGPPGIKGDIARSLVEDIAYSEQLSGGALAREALRQANAQYQSGAFDPELQKMNLSQMIKYMEKTYRFEREDIALFMSQVIGMTSKKVADERRVIEIRKDDKGRPVYKNIKSTMTYVNAVLDGFEVIKDPRRKP